jgi:hypothetical protein
MVRTVSDVWLIKYYKSFSSVHLLNEQVKLNIYVADEP